LLFSPQQNRTTPRSNKDEHTGKERNPDNLPYDSALPQQEQFSSYSPMGGSLWQAGFTDVDYPSQYLKNKALQTPERGLR
jgi:hypothetical protein